jgi:hypothetical protein
MGPERLAGPRQDTRRDQPGGRGLNERSRDNQFWRPFRAPLLGDPGTLAPNPHIDGGPSMKLYKRPRVMQAEAGEQFRKHVDISRGRMQ